MECTAVFSGRSAGKGKDRVGGGPSTLSQMAVAGPTDVLVSASGYIQCMSWSSTYALNFCTVQLLSWGWCYCWWWGYYHQITTLNSKTKSGLLRKTNDTLTSEQVAGFSSEPLCGVCMAISGCLPQLTGGMTGCISASCPVTRQLGFGSSSRHCKGKQAWWLSMAAQRWDKEAKIHCIFENWTMFLLSTAAALHHTLLEVHNGH